MNRQRIGYAQQPDMRAIHGTKLLRLVKDYWYCWPDKGLINVPAGFECDGASIPRWLWTAAGVRLGGRIRAAALVHDCLYRHLGEYDGLRYTKAEADTLFKQMMLQAGMEKNRARRCYWAVRLFGGPAWPSLDK